MISKTEIITKVFLSLFLVFVIGKMAAVFLRPFLSNLFSGKKKKKPNLDRMIERQSSLFRQKHGVSASKPKSPKEKYSSLTEKKYKKEFEKQSNKKNEKIVKDLGKVIDLLDHLQWGDGPIFVELNKFFKTRFNVNIDISEISNSFKQIINNDIVLILNKKSLPTFNEIYSLFKTKVFISSLIEEINTGESSLAHQIAKKGQVTAQDILYALEIEILTNAGHTHQEVYSSLLSGKSKLKQLSSQEINNHIFSYLNVVSDKEFITLETLISTLLEQGFVFNGLRPLPPLQGKNDLVGACRVLGITLDDDLKIIKRKYKILANKKHPDRLSGMGLPDKYIKLANDNFIILQEAFELIKQNKG